MNADESTEMPPQECGDCETDIIKLNSDFERSISVATDTSSVCSFPCYCPDPNLEITEIKETLTRHLNEKYKDILQAFQNFDKRGTGLVLKTQLKQILRTYCIPLTDEQFYALIKEFNLEHDAQIRYVDFLGYFVAYDKVQDETIILKECIPNVIPIEELELILKHKIFQNLPKIIQGMWLHDVNKDGFIQSRELRKILENYCCSLTDIQYKMLWHRYDPQNKGIVNYKDFLIRLGVNVGHYEHLMPEEIIEKAKHWPEKLSEEEMCKIKLEQLQRKAAKEGRDDPVLQGLTLDEIMEVFKHKLKCRGHLLERAFKSFDPADTGFISLENFHGIINYIIMPISEALFLHILDRLTLVLASPRRLFWRNFLQDYCQPHSSLDKKTSKVAAKPDPLVNRLQELVSNPEEHFKSIFGSDDKFSEILLNSEANKKIFKNNQNVTRSELKLSLMKLLKFHITAEDLKWLLIILDPLHTNVINFKNYAKLFRKGERTLNWDDAKSEKESFLYKHLHDEKLKKKLKSYVLKNYQEIEKAILAQDWEQSGWIKLQPFRDILEYFCFPLTDSQYEEILKDFDVYMNQFEHKKFFDKYKKYPDDETQKWISVINRLVPFKSVSSIELTLKEAEEYLREAVQSKRNTFLRDFQALDYADTGSVHKDDVRLLFNKHAFRMSDYQFEELWKKFPKNQFDKLVYCEFVEKFGEKTNLNLPTPPLSPLPVTRQGIRPQTAVSHHSILSVDMFEERKKPRVRPYNQFPVMKELMNPVKVPHSPNLYGWPQHTKVITARGVKPGSSLNVKSGKPELTVHDTKDEQEPDISISGEQIKVGKEIEELEKGAVVNTHSVPTSTDYYLQKLILWRWKEIIRKCKLHDQKGTCVLPAEKFKEILSHVGIAVKNKKAQNELIKTYGIISGTSINYWDFLLKFLLHVGTTRNLLTKAETAAKNELENYVESTKLKLQNREQISLEKFITLKYKEIKKRCEELDRSKNNVIAGDDLKDILEQEGIPFKNEEIDRKLTSVGILSGVPVDYLEFLSKYVLHLGKSSANIDVTKRRKLPPARIKVSVGEENPYLTKTLLSMRGKVMKNFNSLNRQFRSLDKKMTGLIDCNMFRKLLCKIGINLHEEQVFRILEYYDPNLTGKIAYGDFLRAFVRSA